MAQPQFWGWSISPLELPFWGWEGAEAIAGRRGFQRVVHAAAVPWRIVCGEPVSLSASNQFVPGVSFPSFNARLAPDGASPKTVLTGSLPECVKWDYIRMGPGAGKVVRESLLIAKSADADRACKSDRSAGYGKAVK